MINKIKRIWGFIWEPVESCNHAWQTLEDGRVVCFECNISAPTTKEI